MLPKFFGDDKRTFVVMEVERMKINPLHSVNPYQKRQEITSKRKTAASQRDEVQISAEAKQMQQSSQISLERQEKIKEIKEKIDKGTYKVNAHEVARKFYEFWSK